jgi:hypothetical protein
MAAFEPTPVIGALILLNQAATGHGGSGRAAVDLGQG